MKRFAKATMLVLALVLTAALAACVETPQNTSAATTEPPAPVTTPVITTTEAAPVAPAVTTEAPAPVTTEATTTAAPVVTTAAPVVTTKAPVVTTKAPVVTTKAPVVTTKATTAATTKAPVVTTAATKVETPTGEMHLYSGELHSHTVYSDGKGTIAEAYKYARDNAKLDFFAITDHSLASDSDSAANTMTAEKLATLKKTAESFTVDGKFVALIGFEQTYTQRTGFFGHLNSLNTETLTHAYEIPLETYLASMANDNDAVVMFNHPGYTWGNFVDFAYNADYDKVVNLIEIKGATYDEQYALALSKGWHVAPSYNEDNHNKQWGNVTEACGYILAPSLTKDNVIDAFRNNRVYTTTDKSLKIYYKINDTWMGGRLDNPDTLHVSVDLSTNKAALGTVSLVAEDNVIVQQISLANVKNYTWEFDLSPEYDYYYVKVQNANAWAVTAPIWVENRDLLNITDISQSLVMGATENANGVTVTMKNDAKQVMTDVTVSFYKSNDTGFNLTTAKPVATVNVGTIAAGATADATAYVQYAQTQPRITAVVRGTVNGKPYADVIYTYLSALYISEAYLSSPTANKTASPYVFFEIYNNSNEDIDLSRVSLRFYGWAGITTSDMQAEEFIWDLFGTVKANSTMVVWMKTAKNTLTVANFNQQFSTDLVEGEDIIVLENTNLLPTDYKAKQLELVRTGMGVHMVWINWANETDIRANKAITFSYPTSYTQVSSVVSSRETPTPGTVDTSLVPTLVTQ